MIGQGPRIGSILFIALLLLVQGLALNGPADVRGGGTRAPGLDIAVEDITSHRDNGAMTLTPQVVKARLVNAGTQNYSLPLNVTLRIFFLLNGTTEQNIFNSTVDLGGSLRGTGNRTNVTFLSFKPGRVGKYLFRIIVNAQDDHTMNNTLTIGLNAMAGTPAGVKVSVDTPSKLLPRGQSTKDTLDPYIFTVENTGPLNDTYTIDIDSQWVEPGWSNRTRDLQPRETQSFAVHVKVPLTADPFDFDVLVYNATSTRNNTVSDWVSVNTSIPKKASVEVTVEYGDPQEVFPGGDWADFLFRVTNTGDFADIYDLGVSSRPARWEVKLNSPATTANIPGSYVVPKGGRNYVTVSASIKLPPLRYETMEEDTMIWGDVGALILTATSERSGVSGSGEGTAHVGLVHTVQMAISPPNATIGFRADSSQATFFNIDVRSVNNIKNGQGIDMDVNLTLPDGPTGVLFTPVWSPAPNMTESVRWIARVPVGTLKLKGGEWSKGQLLRVDAPIFPYQGTATVTVEAVPMLLEGVSGRAVHQSKSVNITVEPPFIDFVLEPPKTAFFGNANISEDDDADDNGVEDWREGAPGETKKLPFNITNMGNSWDRYHVQVDLTVIEPASTTFGEWGLKYNFTTPMVIPYWYDPSSEKTSALAWVELVIPPGAPIGETVNVSMRAVSMADMEFHREGPLERRASVFVQVKQGFALDLEPEASSAVAEPGETVLYRLNISNNGNGRDDVEMNFLGEVPAGWNVELNDTRFELSPLERKRLEVRVTPDETTARDTVLSLRVRAGSRISTRAQDEVWLNTTVAYRGGVEISLTGPLDIIWKYPGEEAVFVMGLKNTGNGNDSVDLEVIGAEEPWTAVIRDRAQTMAGAGSQTLTVFVPRSASIELEVKVTVPSLRDVFSSEELSRHGLMAGTIKGFLLVAEPQGYASVNDSLELQVGVLQEHRASINLQSSSNSADVLPGETAMFTFNLQNTGNGEDLVRAKAVPRNLSARHSSWTQMDNAIFGLSPFESRTVNMSITPDPEDSPMFHEMVDILVDAMAGDNNTYWRIRVSVRVVMAALSDDGIVLDLGTREDLVIRLCNMPDPGVPVTPNWPLNKAYTITTTVMNQDAQGWEVLRPSALVNLTQAYQTYELRVPIRAPSDLLTGSPYANIEVTVYGGPMKEEVLWTRANAVYFDAYIDMDRTTFRNLVEGGKGKAIINVVVVGTRGQESVPIEITVGEEVYTTAVQRTDPQQFVGYTQEVQLEVDFDLPALNWYQKSKEMTITITLDPQDNINENTVEGKVVSEDNNVLVKDFTIVNSSPPALVLWFSGGVLVFLLAGGLGGYFFLERRNSWFLVPLSCGLVGAFSLLFFLPLETTDWGAGTANDVGAVVIVLDLLLLAPAMIFLFSKAGDAYILFRVNSRKEKRIEGGLEEIRSMAVPYLISLAGGFLMGAVPVFFWVVFSELDEGSGAVIDALVGSGPTVPAAVILVAVPLISLAVQFVLMSFKLWALKGIGSTWDQLDRLKHELGEGLK